MTARHEHVADDLRRQIAAGRYAVGTRLPSEVDLAARYRVSVPTLRDGLELLRAEGLIDKFQGRGNFVRRPVERLVYPSADVRDLHIAISAGELGASAELGARLDCAEGTPITEYVLLTLREDTPHCLAHLYVPVAVLAGEVLNVSSPWGDDLLDHLAAGPGPRLELVDEQVTARFPTSAEAQPLRITARTPVLALHRRARAEDGSVIAYALLVMPGDRAAIAFVRRAREKAEDR